MENFVMGIQSIMEINEFQTFFKLVLIVLLSGFVGYERETWNKPAGFRTHVLVGISAVLVMICGDFLYDQTGADPTRIPAQLLSGIGFLGAGTILRDGFNVKGLTTAAGLLAVTCIGLSVGAGYYLGAIIATAVVYAVLSYSHVLSDRLEHYNYLDLDIKADRPKDVLDSIKTLLTRHKLEIVKMKLLGSDDDDQHIKIMAKYKKSFNTNNVVADIMKLEKVKEVLEIKEEG